MVRGRTMRGAVYNVFPFDNQLVAVDMKASEVLALLTESVRRNNQTSFTSGWRDKLSFANHLVTREPLLVANTSANEVPEGYTRFPRELISDSVASLPPAPI